MVDDNQANLQLMVYLLRAFGHEPLEVDNALEAVRTAGTEPFDLVIADILMPQIDGYELARRMKANPRSRDVPLVAVTALAMGGDRERILSNGFDGYIAKPIDPQTFVAQIEAFLRG